MPVIALGEYRANSPDGALRWLRERAGRLDIAYTRPVRAWLHDTREQTRARALMAAGDSYVFTATDSWGMRYVFTAEPVDCGGAAEPLGSRRNRQTGPEPDTSPEFRTASTHQRGDRIAQERTLKGRARALLRRAWNRLVCWAWAVEEWWRRHVTQRELHRRLDTLPLLALAPPGRHSPKDLEASRRRLVKSLARARALERMQHAGAATPPW